ncbi:MAG: accessory factor UbiK family protein [Pseudomonadota bacterium]
MIGFQKLALDALLTPLKHTLTDKIMSGEFIDQSKEEIQASVRILLESGLRKMDLVSREEFDAQCLMLEKTRTQLDELSQQLKELEQSHHS